GSLLEIEVDCRNDVLARLWFHALDFVLYVTATIDDNLPVTVATSQILVVNLLESFLSDNVAGLVAFVVVFLLLQLLLADLADVSEHMCELSIRWIATLRNLLDAHRPRRCPPASRHL